MDTASVRVDEDLAPAAAVASGPASLAERADEALAFAQAGFSARAGSICAELMATDLPALAGQPLVITRMVAALLAAGQLEQLGRLLRSQSNVALRVLGGTVRLPGGVAVSRCPSTGRLLLIVDEESVCRPGAACEQAAMAVMSALSS